MDVSSTFGVDQGNAGWQASQSTLQAFKAFYATLSAQGEAIKSLERSRDEMALTIRNDINAAAQKKANSIDVAARFAEVEAQLKGKADVSDMDRRALKGDMDASLKMQMAEVLALLTTKANEADSRISRSSVEDSISKQRAEAARLAAGLEEVRSALNSKAVAADMAIALASKADRDAVEAQLREKADRAALTEMLATKADVATLTAAEDDLKRMVSEVQEALARKAERLTVEQDVRELHAEVDRGSLDAAKGLQDMSTALNQALEAHVLEAQGDLDDLGSALRNELYGAVADVTERHSAEAAAMDARLESKPDTGEVQQLIDKSTSEATSSIAAEIADLRLQVARSSHLAAQVEALQQSVAVQGDQGRVLQAALEAKANIEDVNKALAEVCKELEVRGPPSDQGGVQAPVLPPSVSPSSAGLSLMGRWLWKCNSTLVGGVLPWNVQAVNTDPAVLEWAPDSSVITCHVPGLWQLSFGFFSRSRPVVQVFVNGEPVLTSQHAYKSTPLKSFPDLQGGGSSNQGATKQVQQHSCGNVSGLTGSEFFSLPAGSARLAVTLSSFDSAERIEGFLQLQKL